MTRRRSLTDTRAALLEAGAALLTEEGVPVTLDQISMIDVCRRAGLSTAGSAYKIWPNQAAYRDELLQHLITRSTEAFAAGSGLNPTSGAPAAADTDSFVDAVTARVATDAESYPLYLVAWLTQQSNPDHAARFARAEAEWVERREHDLARLLEDHDRELVEPFDIQAVTTMLSALAEGLVIRRRASPGLVPATVPMPTDDDDDTRVDRSPIALGVEAILTATTRPRS